MLDINEAIADAKAEEETKKTKAEIPVRDPNEGVKVAVDLNEYILLNQKAADLDRLLSAIIDSMGLNYSGEELTISREKDLAYTIRALYPNTYADLLRAAKAAQEKE